MQPAATVADADVAQPDPIVRTEDAAVRQGARGDRGAGDHAGGSDDKRPAVELDLSCESDIVPSSARMIHPGLLPQVALALCGGAPAPRSRQGRARSTKRMLDGLPTGVVTGEREPAGRPIHAKDGNGVARWLQE